MVNDQVPAANNSRVTVYQLVKEGTEVHNRILEDGQILIHS